MSPVRLWARGAENRVRIGQGLFSKPTQPCAEVLKRMERGVCAGVPAESWSSVFMFHGGNC